MFFEQDSLRKRKKAPKRHQKISKTTKNGIHKLTRVLQISGPFWDPYWDQNVSKSRPKIRPVLEAISKPFWAAFEGPSRSGSPTALRARGLGRVREGLQSFLFCLVYLASYLLRMLSLLPSCLEANDQCLHALRPEASADYRPHHHA